jgi:Type IV secretory system Conjugative DNA transfer
MTEFSSAIRPALPATLIASQDDWERLIGSFETSTQVCRWLHDHDCHSFIKVDGVGPVRLQVSLVFQKTLILRGVGANVLTLALTLAWSLWKRGQIPFPLLVRLFSVAAEVHGAEACHVDGHPLLPVELELVQTRLHDPRTALGTIGRLCQATFKPWAPNGAHLWAIFLDETRHVLKCHQCNPFEGPFLDEFSARDLTRWDDLPASTRAAMIAEALDNPLTVLSIDGACQSLDANSRNKHHSSTTKPNAGSARWYAVRQIGCLSEQALRVLQIALHMAEQKRIGSAIVDQLIRALVIENRENIILNSPYLPEPGDRQLTERVRAMLVTEPALHVVGRTLQLLQQEYRRLPPNSAENDPLATLMDVGDWMSVHSVMRSKLFTVASSPFTLALGSLETGHSLHFKGDQSLVTIAPPGAGKTRGFVFPNLRDFRGSVLVLDVKGECYAATAKHRRGFSDVYLFAPEEPGETGHRFNPLQFLSRDPRLMLEDARVLADVMVMSSGGDARFFDDRARDLLVSILVLLLDRERCTGMKPALAAMHQASRVGGEELRIILEEMAVSPIPALQERAAELISMIGGLGGKSEDSAQRTVLNIFETLRQHLSAFEGERIREITSGVSAWDPADMRERPITVYLRVSPAAMISMAPVLRLVIACHLHRLMPAGRAAAAPGRLPVLAIFDELPQLGAMKQIESAVHVGRSYGLRSWLFAQNLGQLGDAYGPDRARALINACGVQIWMNPLAEDAQRLSDMLGFASGAAVIEKRLASARQLAGPEYRDVAVVQAIGEKPAKVLKAALTFN